MLKHRNRIEIIEGDITALAVDAIVNAANNRLGDGGGVCGAIHRAAGPELAAFCQRLNGCETGQAKLTPGFRLPARAIIHAVGPIWQDGRHGEADLLASCYRAVLKIAADEGFRSIAFPAISCGIFGFPPEQAVPIALAETNRALDTMPRMQQVIFCCFGQEMAALYRKAVQGQGDSE